MTTTKQTDSYQKALDLAETGKYEEAFEHIQQHLETAADDPEVLNDAGAMLHCLGRYEEAVDHLQKAKNLMPDSAEILWNLTEAYLAVGKASKVCELFDVMQELGILNADMLNRTANVFLNEDCPLDALKTLHRSLEVWSDQEILKPMIEIIRLKTEQNNPE